MKRLLVVALLSSTACFVDPAGPPPPMGPPPQGGFGPVAGGPPPGGGAMGGGGVIEAGCSYNGTQLPGDIGNVFQISCPANCDASGNAWGTDVYTADSGICRAAIHAGLISPAGGVVAVRLEPGRPAYRGSARNGIQSSDYGQYPKSYVLLPSGGQSAAAGPPPPPAQYAPPPAAQYPPPPPAQYPPPPAYAQPAPAGYAPPPMQAIEAGCSFNAGQLRGDIGSSHLVNCPAGCFGAGGGVWGSDAYTADSRICRAAIHAGLITDAGGTFVVTLDPGRPAYRGSIRNNVHSSDYGQYPKSFHLSRP